MSINMDLKVLTLSLLVMNIFMLFLFWGELRKDFALRCWSLSFVLATVASFSWKFFYFR